MDLLVFVWGLIFRPHTKEFTLLNLRKHEPGDSHQDIFFTSRIFV